MTTHRDAAVELRYLLGQLPEEEHARIERALLEDEDAFQQLLALEDELFHDYAQGGLDPEQRRRFEERFLASEEGRRRLADARALLGQVRSDRRRGERLTRFLLPAAAVLLLSAGAWLLARRDARNEAPVAVLTPPAPTRSVALALAPGAVRDVAAAARRARLAPDDALVLTLSLPAGDMPQRLQARVMSAEGKPVWSTRALLPRSSPGGRVVVLELPRGALPEGDYQLVLSSDTASPLELADYAFTVLRR